MGKTTPTRTPIGLATCLMLEVAALSAALGIALFARPVHAAPANKPAGCLIEPEQVADVGSPVTGVIESLNVALGDTVDAGQPVVRLRADVERANANVALLRAQVDAEVKAAQANLELARQKVRRTEQLLTQNFVSTQALEQARAETEVAAQKLKLAQSQQSIYAREEAVAQAQLNLRTLRSPIKGVVIERYSNLGERVEDKPVVRIAAIDPLRVSLMVPIAQYGQLTVGNALVIRPDMPGAEPVKATVTYVDKVVDAASNSFRVRLSLPNPGNRLPGGLRCKADLTAQATPPAPSNMPPATSPAAKPAVGAQAPRQPVITPVMAKPAAPAPMPVPVPATLPPRLTTQASVRTVSYAPAAQPMMLAKPSGAVTAQAAPAQPMPAIELALRPALTLSGHSLKRIALHEALSPFVDQLHYPPSSPRPARRKAQQKQAEPTPRLNATYTLASAR